MLYRHLLHGIRDPLHGVSPRSDDFIVVGATAAPRRRRVVELVADIDELDGRGITVNVYQTPQGPSGFHTAEEYPLLFAVDAEVDVSRGGDVVEQDGALAAESLGKGFGPVAGFVRQVGTGVFGQAVP